MMDRAARDSPAIRMATSSFVKGKAEHLYSALHGIQTTLKRSGMDHTVVGCIDRDVHYLVDGPRAAPH